MAQSSLLLFSLSTLRFGRVLNPSTVCRRLLSRLTSHRLAKAPPLKAWHTSRSLRLEISKSRRWSKKRCPTCSSRVSTVSLPRYLDLAAACSLDSTIWPSRTLSFFRWYTV